MPHDLPLSGHLMAGRLGSGGEFCIRTALTKRWTLGFGRREQLSQIVGRNTGCRGRCLNIVQVGNLAVSAGGVARIHD